MAVSKVPVIAFSAQTSSPPPIIPCKYSGINLLISRLEAKQKGLCPQLLPQRRTAPQQEETSPHLLTFVQAVPGPRPPLAAKSLRFARAPDVNPRR